MNMLFKDRLLKLSGLDDNPPKNIQDIQEALDTVLQYWFNVLADDDNERIKISKEISQILEKYLD